MHVGTVLAALVSEPCSVDFPGVLYPFWLLPSFHLLFHWVPGTQETFTTEKGVEVVVDLPSPHIQWIK